MRTLGWIAALALLAPGAAAAQSTTADGVQALIRGDYGQAAAILKPLSEDSPEPDPLALFFMASLYHWGQGVGIDQNRACGLYLRSATPANPLMPVALELARSIHQDLPFLRNECVEASAGPAPDQPSLVSGAVTPLPSAESLSLTTADGVAAFVQGDYRRAADLLRAIAEAWPPRDHVAEFLMAALYESGRVGPADLTRACALYVRASSEPTSPFGRHAQDLWRMLQLSLGKETFGACARLANVGFHHGFHPVTFWLGPDHSIELRIDGGSITYEGREHPVDPGLDLTGAVFVRIAHKELLTGRGTFEPRHFIEVFFWAPHPLPETDAGTWLLVWQVHEVVGPELVGVMMLPVLTIEAEHPPRDLAFDPSQLAHLTVNDYGEAEWVVSSGPDRGRDVIETYAERREREARKRARAEADERVDWGRQVDPDRAPSLAYVDASGCGHAFVYGWTDDRTEAITIQADAKTLGLSDVRRTFDLAWPQPELEVAVHVFNRPKRQPFCTDVGGRQVGDRQETWRPVGGTVTIELSSVRTRAAGPQRFRATVVLLNAEFASPTGVRVGQTQPIAFTVEIHAYFN